MEMVYFGYEIINICIGIINSGYENINNQIEMFNP
jgi:hypothetical protein